MSDEIVKHKTVAPGPIGRADELVQEEQVYEYLGFVLADELYALPLTAIREILKVPPVTEVPRAPHDVMGIISVRGRVTTVLDLRRRLRMSESPRWHPSGRYRSAPWAQSRCFALRVPTEALLTAAAEAASGEAKPIGDMRASASYRTTLARVLTLRALRGAMESAGVGVAA